MMDVAPAIQLETTICNELDIGRMQFRNGRTKQAVMARQLFMYAMTRYRGVSSQLVGQYLTMRASTVSRGVAKIEALSDDSEVVRIVKLLRDMYGKSLTDKPKSARIVSINRSHPQGG